MTIFLNLFILSYHHFLLFKQKIVSNFYLVFMHKSWGKFMLKLYVHRATAKKFYPQAFQSIPSPSPKLHLLIYVFRICWILIITFLVNKIEEMWIYEFVANKKFMINRILLVDFTSYISNINIFYVYACLLETLFWYKTFS